MNKFQKAFDTAKNELLQYDKKSISLEIDEYFNDEKNKSYTATFGYYDERNGFNSLILLNGDNGALTVINGETLIDYLLSEYESIETVAVWGIRIEFFNEEHGDETLELDYNGYELMLSSY